MPVVIYVRSILRQLQTGSESKNGVSYDRSVHTSTPCWDRICDAQNLDSTTGRAGTKEAGWDGDDAAEEDRAQLS